VFPRTSRVAPGVIFLFRFDTAWFDEVEPPVEKGESSDSWFLDVPTGVLNVSTLEESSAAVRRHVDCMVPTVERWRGSWFVPRSDGDDPGRVVVGMVAAAPVWAST
jgi:hypothetical protein